MLDTVTPDRYINYFRELDPHGRRRRMPVVKDGMLIPRISALQIRWQVSTANCMSPLVAR